MMVTKVSPVAEKAILEMMNDALDAAEPGDKDGSPVGGFKEHGGDAALSVETAGHIKVWNTETGDLSIINRNMLATQLNKKGEQGQRAFTTDPAKVKGKPMVGTLTCLLHTGHADRPIHAALGFRTCKKSNLQTPLDVRTHMRSKHKREWESLENSRQEIIAAEERLVRQTLIGRAAPAPEAIQRLPVVAAARPPVSEPCAKCGGTVSAKNSNGINLARLAHQKKCVPITPAG